MNKRSYIIILVFLLLSLLVIAFFLWPYFNEIRMQSKELVSERDRTSSLNMQIRELPSFKKEYDSYLPNMQKIGKMFIDPQDPIAFIEFMENAALDSEIVLKVSPQFSSEDESRSIAFQLAGNGIYNKVLNFIKKLEYGPYLINIEDLNISIQKEGGAPKTNIVKDLSEEVQANLLIRVLSK